MHLAWPLEQISYLGRKVESLPVTQHDLFCGRGYSKIRQIRPCFTASKDNDGLIDTKVCPFFEPRRVKGDGDLLNAGYPGDIRHHMKPGADGDGIALPAAIGSFLLVDDGVTSSVLS